MNWGIGMDNFDLLLMFVVIVQVALYLIMLIELSRNYRSYLLSSSSHAAKRKARLILVISVITFYAFLLFIVILLWSTIILIAFLLRLIILTVFVIIPAVIVLAFLVRQLYFSRCLEKWEEELDGIKFVVCRSEVFNAWRSQDGRIYVSLPLKKALSKEELKAIIHHELGHAKHSRLTLLYSFVITIWIWLITDVALLVTLQREISLSSILIALYLLFLGASLTLSAMMISWISEHEADREAIEGAGPRSFMTAMIKFEIYRWFRKFLDDVKVKDAEEIKKVVDASVQPRKILLTLLKYSWNFPKWILDLSTSPQYQTHPPLQLRLVPATRFTLISS